MKLVILGLKKHEQYYIFHPDKKIGIPINKDEVVLSMLSPFPFEHFSTLDRIPEDLERCYLEVEADISQDEFDSMESAGIRYHRFNNKKIKFIGEYFTPFEYSLEMLNKFGSQLGTYNLTTWVIHYGTQSQSTSEINAMKEIIEIELNQQKDSDFSLTNELSEYIPYLLDKIDKGHRITFGRYGRNTISQKQFNKIELTNKQLITAVQTIDGINKYLSDEIIVEFSPLLHPGFTKDILLNSELFNQILENITEGELMVMKNKGFSMDTIFAKHFPTLKNNLIQLLEYDDNFESLEQYFNSDDYEPEIVRSSVYDYYCCEDCDGYDISEMYPDGIPEDEEYIVDTRIENLLDTIGKWIPFLTRDSKYLFDFIPESMYDEIDNRDFVEILK